MNRYIPICKACNHEVQQSYRVLTDEFYLYCATCKIHEIVYRHDDYHKFYRVERKKLEAAILLLENIL